MQIIYNNENYFVENNEYSVSTIFEKVHHSIEDKSVVFSHLVIDGVEIYENHEEYIEKRLDSISDVEIITRNTKQMIWETMTSVNDYLVRAIPALNKLADGSYEKFTDETWKGINQLAEGMQWILQFVTFTKSTSQQPSNWKEIEESVHACEESFAKLMEGVEMKDTVLISDVLSYEVMPAYEELQKNLAVSLNDKEFLKNVN